MLSHTQHRALMFSVTDVVRSQTIPIQKRFNFRKIMWKDFIESLDKEICNIDPKSEDYKTFVEKVKKTFDFTSHMNINKRDGV